MMSLINSVRTCLPAAALIAAATAASVSVATPVEAAPRHATAKIAVASADIYVRVAPPSRRVVTVRPARPHARAVWIDGYWRWNGGKHVWVGGHWEANPNGTWIAGHWVKRPRGWVWKAGYWRR